jgi:predicted O-methyltransferase YrrM
MFAAVEPLRRRVKTFHREGRHAWLVFPSKWAWHAVKGLRDLAYVPAILLGLKRHSPSDGETLVDVIFDRYGGALRPIQNRTELTELWRLVEALRPRMVIEIGTAGGGTLFLLSRAAEADATLISVDLPGGMFGGGYPRWKARLFGRLVLPGQELHLIRGNSHEPSTHRAVARALGARKVDLLFIDGDHTYEGVRQDFEQYRSLVRPGGLIAFHDVLPSRFDPHIGVAKLWAELKERHQTIEIVEDYDQGAFGLGILTAPETW